MNLPVEVVEAAAKGRCTLFVGSRAAAEAAEVAVAATRARRRTTTTTTTGRSRAQNTLTITITPLTSRTIARTKRLLAQGTVQNTETYSGLITAMIMNRATGRAEMM